MEESKKSSVEPFAIFQAENGAIELRKDSGKETILASKKQIFLVPTQERGNEDLINMEMKNS